MCDIILDQFMDKGRRVTYMTKFFNEYSDGRMPQSICFFRVKIKDKRTRWQRFFDFGRYKKYLSKHLCASQVHPSTTGK